ncbi:hypothetical protein C922_03303 [Plasmodium inui San Antonio 1]|uniref:Uncharacterized protein n=1 Tax=Plasmodium inui San Antonio 1 TaxID=1237626 RepID=W6ZZN2_9APIC|nr:hypothetical protein C922_03303 [Plasmodium inui San Antonio 1]EUD66387.1 hypothetical protein C922_03303 [Plasmodium inui San Antonio 1]
MDVPEAQLSEGSELKGPGFWPVLYLEYYCLEFVAALKYYNIKGGSVRESPRLEQHHFIKCKDILRLRLCENNFLTTTVDIPRVLP